MKRLSVAPPKSPEAEIQRITQEKTELAAQLKKSQEDLDKTQDVVNNLEEQLRKLQGKPEVRKSSGSPKASSSKPATSASPATSSRTGTPLTLSDKEKELAEQLFSWMSLSLKLEALLQDRHTANYDSGALLNKLLTDKTPWLQWPEIIQRCMAGTV